MKIAYAFPVILGAVLLLLALVAICFKAPLTYAIAFGLFGGGLIVLGAMMYYRSRQDGHFIPSYS